MRIIKLFLLFVTIILCSALALLWTPDTDYKQTLEKYHGDKAEFITLANGLRVHIHDTGNIEGKPLLLIHGTSDSLLTWNAITPHLADEFRLISLDLPGHGFSQAPQTMSMQQFIDAGAEVLEHLGIANATWIGNSLGGGIAWRAALERSDKVNALVLIDPSGAPNKQAAKSNLGFRLLRSPVGRFLGKHITPRSLIEKSITGTVADANIVSEEMIDRYWHLLRLPGNRSALASLAQLPRSDEMWNRIGEINVPTLILWGDQDQLTPYKNAPKFNSSIKGSELITYKGIGHMPMIEVPEQAAADIDAFMDKVQ